MTEADARLPGPSIIMQDVFQKYAEEMGLALEDMTQQDRHMALLLHTLDWGLSLQHEGEEE